MKIALGRFALFAGQTHRSGSSLSYTIQEDDTDHSRRRNGNRYKPANSCIHTVRPTMLLLTVWIGFHQPPIWARPPTTGGPLTR